MRKIFLALVLLLSATFALHAEEFTGFLGIPLGTNRLTVYEKMTNNGWERFKNYYDCEEYRGNQLQYEGKDVDHIFFSYDFRVDGDPLYEVDISFKNPFDTEEVFYALINKYNLIDIGDGYYCTPDSKYVFFHYKENKQNYIAIVLKEKFIKY